MPTPLEAADEALAAHTKHCQMSELFDVPLREPVRPISETLSAFTVIKDTFFKPVDHSIFFTAPPLALAQTESPMQLYCYIKQLDDVRKFFRRLDISKHVYPLRSAAELETMCLHGQVFVNITNHHEGIPFVIRIAAENYGMHFMEITITGEGQS